jgi:cyclohexyl-isocyanide hydratase
MILLKEGSNESVDLVYPGMTLLDLVGPLQAWSFLPGYEVQYAWHHSGVVLPDCSLGVQAEDNEELPPPLF